MSKQFGTEQSGWTAEGPGPKRAIQWGTPIGLGAIVVFAMAIALVLLPGVASAISETSVHAYWYISRASAFVAFGLLWLSMLAGLGITSNLSRIWPGMPASFELHRYTAFLGIGFGLVHALVLLGDQYINYNLIQLLVPFLGTNFKPEWVGFGQLSIYLLVVVSLTYYVRDRLGTHVWRLIHMLSFALFLMVLIHGLKSGTDSGNVLALALYWTSGLSILLCSVYRVLHPRDPVRDLREATGLVAVAGRAQTRPSETRPSPVDRPNKTR